MSAEATSRSRCVPVATFNLYVTMATSNWGMLGNYYVSPV